MKTLSKFPHKVQHIENTWIPLRDGTRLGARIWMPVTADREPVPAILEFIPYRKRDWTRPRDERTHPYFAGHGYAAVRVDLRGSGESDGVLEDEYLPQELEDACEILKWLGEQKWCDGNVGMMGISWGGFNALQVAALQPPELKAIITVCSTDDRYADDVHYMSGCLLGDNLSWASSMFAYNAAPPDPEIVGEHWYDMWLKRLRGSGLWLDTWLRHQHRDEYWKHGSVCEDISRIKIPVMAASGWADGYSNAVFRMMADLKVPRRALIGPWSHKYPHMGVPGPAIGFLQEALAWWDQWLKGIDRGQQQEPMLYAWMQDSMQPEVRYKHRPGRWVTEQEWPSKNIREEVYRLERLRLVQTPGLENDEPQQIQSPGHIGQFAGKWCSYSATPDLPGDQRDEDGGSLVYETEPLTEEMDILGQGQVHLRLSCNQPVAMVAARLSDVAPDGKATRVTYGILNLTHRNSHENPEPLEINKQYDIRLELNEVAQTFPRGHRLRLSLSTSYWPLAWLPPKPVMMTVRPSKSRLLLPVRPRREEDQHIRQFEEAEGAPPLKTTQLAQEKNSWKLIRDLETKINTLEVSRNGGEKYLDDIDLVIWNRTVERYSMKADEFDSAHGETEWHRGFRREGWDAWTRTRTVLSCDAENFYIDAELDAYLNGQRIYSQNWDSTIKRNLV